MEYRSHRHRVAWDCPYVVVTPDDGTQGKRLVVILHGVGRSAFEYSMLPARMCGETFAYLIPQAPFPCVRGDDTGAGWIACEPGADHAATREVSEAMVFELATRMCTALECRRDGIGLMGFSQGAAVATTLAVARPETFPTLVVQNGWANHQAVRSARAQTGAPRVLLQHGQQDDVVPLAVAHDLQRALQRQGADAALQTYDTGHEYCDAMLRDAAEFLQ